MIFCFEFKRWHFANKRHVVDHFESELRGQFGRGEITTYTISRTRGGDTWKIEGTFLNR